MAMKRQLIYHTHIDTKQTGIIGVDVRRQDISKKCNIERVSRDGLTLACDSETLSVLMPNKTSVAPKDPVLLDIAFNIPQKIQAKCRVIFARRLSKNEFILELKFSELSESSMQYLDNFIETLLKGENLKAESTPINQQKSLDRSDLKESQQKSLKFSYSKVA